MSTFLDSYPIFENNQVLTSAQLNQLVAYLDEQNRLTRVQLLGDGIACGYELKFNGTDEITIFQGLGITSAGFLIKEGDCVVRRYRPYKLPKGGRYVPFEDPDTTVQDVDLWELLTDDAPTLPTDVINPLNVPSNFVNDKVVLLFLEILDVDLASCLGKSCDENGISREFHLRKLLITRTHLEKVLERTCRQEGLFPAKYDLPEIFMKRALFTNDAPSPNTSNYFVFSQTYVNAMKSTAQPAAGISIYDQLFNALRQTYIDFSPILPEYGGVNPFDNYPSPVWTNYINGSSAGPKYLGMQYFYDFLKDLILAYNEFRDVAFDVMSECCIDMDCFPQHLMLGEVIASGSCKPSPYRHYFLSSPILNNQKDKLARAVSLFRRMVLMVRKFDLPTINNPSTAIIPPSKVAVPILITPSNEKRDPLGTWAIPYYYRINESDADLGTLAQSWNYDYKLKCLFSKGLAPLAYGNQNVVQSTDLGPVQTPLFYNDDPFDFLRIEGHIRASYLSAKDEIEKLIKDFDLPFKVIALRLNGDAFDDIAERCNFDDLRTQYGVLRTELLSLFKNIFDRFGTFSREGIAIRPFPEFLQDLVRDTNTDTRHASIHQPQIGVSNGITAVLDSSASPGGTADASRLFAAAPAPSVFPVYAPLRSMQEVINKLRTDLLDLLNTINIITTTQLPFNITDFRYGYTGSVPDSTPGFIQYYFTALQDAINVKVGFNQLLDLIIRNTKVRNTQELYMDLAAYSTEVIGLLERFITDPKYKSLTFVNYSMHYRINQLKAGDMTLFSNFIKKHPGVEHKAGVKPGGTFILLYPGNAVAVDPVKRNFVVGQIRQITELKNETARLKAKPVMSAEDHLTVANNDAAILNFDLISQDIALPGVPIQRIAIQADQVIADFSLPYLCCCDCECDDIKHPTEEIQLGIPALAVPFYAEYSLGDYAFGKDVSLFADQRQIKQFIIDIVPMLQYDKTRYQESQVRLYLINRFGNKLPASMPVMNTGNFVNVPNSSGQVLGSVRVTNSDVAHSQVFQYSAGQIAELGGIDSFYYMFEIVNDPNLDNPVVLERSTMAAINIFVSRG
jgi:hypothetical protein